MSGALLHFSHMPLWHDAKLTVGKISPLRVIRKILLLFIKSSQIFISGVNFYRRLHPLAPGIALLVCGRFVL